MQYSLDVFSYNGQFLIGNLVDDDDFIDETYEILQEYIDEALYDLLYYSKGRLVIGTIRKFTVPVTIDILPEKPDSDTIAAWTSQASQVCVSSFQAFSKAIALQNPLFDSEEIFELDLKPGSYGVMVFYNDLDKQYDPVTGDDWYHIVFYPGDLIDTKVIKTYIPSPPRYKQRD